MLSTVHIFGRGDLPSSNGEWQTFWDESDSHTDAVHNETWSGNPGRMSFP